MMDERAVQRLFLDKLIGFHTAAAVLEKLGYSRGQAKRIVGEWWEGTEEAMRESDFNE